MNNKLTHLIGALLLLAGLMLVGRDATFANAQSSQTISKEKQAQHSKLYSEKQAEKLTDRADKKSIGTEIRVRKEPGLVVENPAVENHSPSLLNYACASDAVVVGTIQVEESALSDDQTTVFTDYEVAIDEVLKNTSSTAMASGSTITVTRPGGLVEYNGRKIRVREEDGIDTLGVNVKYLFFLNDLPDTNSFQLRSNAAVLLNKNGFVNLDSKTGSLSAGNHSIDEVLTEARKAANIVCRKRPGN